MQTAAQVVIATESARPLLRAGVLIRFVIAT